MYFGSFRELHVMLDNFGARSQGLAILPTALIPKATSSELFKASCNETFHSYICRFGTANPANIAMEGFTIDGWETLFAIFRRPRPPKNGKRTKN
jgi:hypothetical protein